MQQTKRRLRTGALLLLTASGLSACAEFETGGAPSAPPAGPPAASAPTRPAATASLPRPTRKPTPPSAPGQQPQAAQQTAPVSPDHLIGLGEDAARDWLGDPTQQTDAPPATIWRYVSRDCEVDVYFYLDLQQRIMRALHYEIRRNDTAEQQPDRCFQQLVSEHRERNDGTVSNSAR